MGFKVKNHDYLNMKTKTPQYGFKIFVGGEWCLASLGSRLILFDTPEERDIAVKEFKAGN